MRSDWADARHLLKDRDLGIRFAETEHLGPGLLLGVESDVQHLIQREQLVGNLWMVETGQIGVPSTGRVQTSTVDLEHAPAAEGGFGDVSSPVLLLEGDLLLAKINMLEEYPSGAPLGAGLEDSPVVIGSLVDGMQLAKTKKPAQVEGIGDIAFVRIATDEPVLSWVADEDLVDVRRDRPGSPAGEGTGLDGETLRVCVNGDNPRDKFRFGCRKLLVPMVGALRVHDAERARSCMQI